MSTSSAQLGSKTILTATQNTALQLPQNNSDIEFPKTQNLCMELIPYKIQVTRPNPFQPLAREESNSGFMVTGNNLGDTRNNDTYDLLKLPNELLMEIFIYLGPASRRLLGATSQRLYKIWKAKHYEKSIRVHCSELPMIKDLVDRKNLPKDTNLSLYSKIITHWLFLESIFSHPRAGSGQSWSEFRIMCALQSHQLSTEHPPSFRSDTKTKELNYTKDMDIVSDRIMEYELNEEIDIWHRLDSWLFEYWS